MIFLSGNEKLNTFVGTKRLSDFSKVAVFVIVFLKPKCSTIITNFAEKLEVAWISAE